jgi:adenylate kinase
MQKIFFLAGSHGVGKSTLGQSLQGLRGLEHLEASKLIGKFSDSTDYQKKVNDIPLNQKSLIEAFRFERERIKGDILIDGHFALLNSENKAVLIAEDVYSDMKINAVILLEARATEVEQRLKKRDGLEVDLGTIEDLAEVERFGAERIKRKLNIPMLVVKENYRLEEVCDFIDSIRAT